jgi:hypothetical protein
MPNEPAAGDVVISIEQGTCCLSIFPHPHRVSFKELPKAIEIANRWVSVQPAAIWVRRPPSAAVRLEAEDA